MAWNTIAATDVLAEFTPQEQAALQGIQGADTQLALLLAGVVGAVRGAISAGGYALDAAGTVPDQLRPDCIALARWRWLTSFPTLKAFQTEARRDLAKAAQERIDAASNQKLNVEAPASAATPTGNWNSERKILPRAFPVPAPSTQFQTTTDTGYANPDGPENL